MHDATEWKQYWDKRSEEASSDFEFDRGIMPRDQQVENISNHEMVSFIGPKPTDVVLDAGCGTGVNIFLLHSAVKRIVGIDYSQGAVDRCRRRLESSGIGNADVQQGSITDIPLPDSFVDKVLCLSVLQYVDDKQVTQALTEFRRVLKKDGILILHVKNLSSLYLSTLWLGQRAKLLLGRPCKLCHYRTYSWYAKALTSLGFDLLDYNSFNLLVLPKMPRSLVIALQKFELRSYRRPLLRLGWVRRHGSDLKIKTRLRKHE
jgi:ubiquinone/menaquinone biosynthesis C-methylase UbiE